MFLDVQPSTRIWLKYQCYTIKENWPFLSQKITIANSSANMCEISCPSPFSALDFGLAWNAQVLCILTRPLWVHMYNCSTIYRRYCFPVVIIDPSCGTLSALASAMVTEPWEVRVRAHHSSVSYSLHLGLL